MVQLERDHEQERKTHLSRVKDLERASTTLSSLNATHAEEIASLKLAHSQLTQSLDAERGRARSAEHRVQEMARATEADAKRNLNMRAEIMDSQTQLSESLAAQDNLRRLLAAKHEQLEDKDTVLRDASVLYSKLANNCTSKIESRRLQLENARMHMYTTRLERKIADRDAQVTELAHMIRHFGEQNHLLLSEISDAQLEITSLRSTESPHPQVQDVDIASLALDASRLAEERADTNYDALLAITAVDQALSSCTQSVLSHTLSHYDEHLGVAQRHEIQAELLVGHYETHTVHLVDQLSLLEASLAIKQDELSESNAIASELRARDEESAQRTHEAEECLAQQVEETKRAKAHHKTLIEALGRAKMGEAALEAQVSGCVSVS